MREDGRIAGAMRGLHRGERFCERSDLVDLHEQRIGDAHLHAFGQARDIGDEEIVADELDLFADGVGELLPALPVVLGHAVLNRHDRIGAGKFGEIGDLLVDRAGDAFPFVDIFAVLEEFRRGDVGAKMHVDAGLEARALDRFHDEVERGFGGGKIGREAALVADRGAQPRFFERAFQRVEDFGAPADRLAHIVSARRQDHEFLEIDRIVGVRAAVDDVHHRRRQHARADAADIAVERQGGGFRGGLGDGERDAENSVGAETRLVRRAVELDHRLVDPDLVLGVEADERAGDLVIDIVDGGQRALAEISLGVPVAFLDRLMRAGRGAGGHGGASRGSVLQRHIDLDGRIPA